MYALCVLYAYRRIPYNTRYLARLPLKIRQNQGVHAMRTFAQMQIVKVPVLNCFERKTLARGPFNGWRSTTLIYAGWS